MENQASHDSMELAKSIAAAVLLSLIGTIPGMFYEWLMGTL